jgi:hypothetical protein
MADNVLHAGVRGITDLITMPGLVNLDFADIRTIMTKMGKALMGTGEASGENRAVIACEEAISNPLLDDISIRGAKGVLVNMTGGPDMTLFEADLAVNTIKKEVDPSANIIFGSAFNEDMKGKIRISVVATGIDEDGFYSAPRDEATKSKSQMVYEIKNTSPNQEAIVNAAMQGKRTFFDPGAITSPDQDLYKSNEENFEKNNNNKQFSEESSSQLTANGEVENTKDWQDEKDDQYPAISFAQEEDSFDYAAQNANRELEEKIENENKINQMRDEEFAKKELQNKETRKKQRRKKEGFSLFGFMHIGDSKNSEISSENESEPQGKISKKQIVTIEDDEELVLEKKSLQVNYKTQPIIEDEEVLANKAPDLGAFANSEEDDMLNVPAFFRRKK